MELDQHISLTGLSTIKKSRFPTMHFEARKFRFFKSGIKKYACTVLTQRYSIVIIVIYVISQVATKIATVFRGGGAEKRSFPFNKQLKLAVRIFYISVVWKVWLC